MVLVVVVGPHWIRETPMLNWGQSRVENCTACGVVRCGQLVEVQRVLGPTGRKWAPLWLMHCSVLPQV